MPQALLSCRIAHRLDLLGVTHKQAAWDRKQEIVSLCFIHNFWASKSLVNRIQQDNYVFFEIVGTSGEQFLWKLQYHLKKTHFLERILWICKDRPQKEPVCWIHQQLKFQEYQLTKALSTVLEINFFWRWILGFVPLMATTNIFLVYFASFSASAVETFDNDLDQVPRFFVVSSMMMERQSLKMQLMRLSFERTGLSALKHDVICAMCGLVTSEDVWGRGNEFFYENGCRQMSVRVEEDEILIHDGDAAEISIFFSTSFCFCI